VLVLDRSRSMDRVLLPGRRAHGARAARKRWTIHEPDAGPLRESNGKVARRLLAEFTAGRPEDRFALVVFSTLPIRVLDSTRQGRGRAGSDRRRRHRPRLVGNQHRAGRSTGAGNVREPALHRLAHRDLVSDGGDRLDPDMARR